MRVAIIDYGSGNLRSVAKAFERAGNDVHPSIEIDVTSDAHRVALIILCCRVSALMPIANVVCPLCRI